jgi:archaeoflavoprotein AfpA
VNRLTENVKKRIAWGITGSGDKLSETVEVMKQVQKQFKDVISIEVFLSKAAVNVTKQYKVYEDLHESFGRVMVEVDSNAPFLAGWLETERYAFLLVAPATSNTVAKIAVGISDSLLSNAVVMALKGFVPVYIMPSDIRQGTVTTLLPNGKLTKLKVRKEDAENVQKLEKMEGVSILKKPQEIWKVFEKYFGKTRG